MNGGLRIVGIAVAIAIPLIGAVWGYGALATNVDNNAKQIGKNEAAIAANRERTTRIENGQGRMSEQIGALRRDVGELKGVMGEVLREVRRGNE